MDSKNKPGPNPPEHLHNNDDDDDDHLQTSEAAAPPSYSASYTQPDMMTSPDDIASSARSAPPPAADAIELKPHNIGPKSTMEYAQPSEPLRQQDVDFKSPFGDSPVPVQCPVCQQRTVSKTKNVSGGYTFGWALGVCAVTGLGCIPFCIGRLKNVEHRCGNCDQKLATWHRYNGRVDRHAWS